MKIDAVNSIPITINDRFVTDIDVLGAYKNALLIIECCGSRDPFSEKLRKFLSISQLLNHNQYLKKLGEVLKNRYRDYYQKTADIWEKIERGQNVIIRYILFTTRRLSEEDRELAEKYSNEIYLVDFNDFCYFDYLSKLTFDHAKYEFFIFLDIKPTEIGERFSIESPRVEGTIVEESREYDIVVFTHLPSFLLKTTHVRRLYSWNPQGFQRLLLEDKIKRLTDFLKREKRGFPNNIIVATHKNRIEYRPDYGNKKFEIIFRDFSYDVFVLIDGQHRLYAFAYNDPEIEHLRESIRLLVTAIIFKDTDEKEMWNRMAELFYTINTTYTRIDPETSIDLQELLWPNDTVSKANKLLRILNSEEGIFLKNKIEFSPFDEEYFGKKLLPRTALIRYSGLKDFFASKSKSHMILHEVYSNLKNDLADYEEDFLPWILKVYFKAVKTSLEEAKGQKANLLLEDTELKEYYFMSVTVIGALLRLLRHFFSSNNPNTEVKRLLKIVKNEKLTLEEKEDKIKQIIKGVLKIVFSKVKFTKEEWEKKGWKSSQWALVEREMIGIIDKRCKKKQKGFGDTRLLKK